MEIWRIGMPDYPNILYTERRLFHYHLSGLSIDRRTGYERADMRVQCTHLSHVHLEPSVHIIRGIMRYPPEIPGVT